MPPWEPEHGYPRTRRDAVERGGSAAAGLDRTAADGGVLSRLLGDQRIPATPVADAHSRSGGRLLYQPHWSETNRPVSGGFRRRTRMHLERGRQRTAQTDRGPHRAAGQRAYAAGRIASLRIHLPHVRVADNSVPA